MDPRSRTESDAPAPELSERELSDVELEEASGGVIGRMDRAQTVASSIDRKLQDTSTAVVSNLK